MLYFTIQNRLQDRTGKVSEAGGARWRFYRRIILGLWSNRLSIGGSTSGSFRWNLELQDCVAGAVFGEVGGWLYLLHALEMTFHMWRRSLMTLIFCGRCSIWWSWTVTLLAPRIGNDVSYVTRISHQIHFAWQAHYLVKLVCDFLWQAQHIVTFWEIAGARNVVFYNTKSSPRSDREGLRSGGCEMTILSSDYPRIMVESSFYWRKHSREFPLKSWASRFRGRRSIWWGWRVTLLAPRIGNDVSYVTQIIDDIDFLWQVQFLVSFKGDFTWSVHCKWGFICDADQWCDAICVAGAVFGEVGGCLLLLRAL